MSTYSTNARFAATANTSIAHLQAYAQIAIDASEKLLALNLDTARTLCELASSSAAQIDLKDPQDTLARQSASQSKGFEHLTDYLRGVGELYVQTQNDVADVGARQFADLQRSFQSLFDEAGKLTMVNPLDIIAAPETSSPRQRKAA
ncbi:MAG TPA: phasin family protein [Thauera sp.]|uniref:phasin family protein n=1 Tax=Thauera sp. TaxID=1905334 RepID=UPI002C5D2E18|nr:phasin family protein [Thauera sp.]HRP24465.1 phasin family protein [Thauera sp.]HRP67026.1 phasin family protein [Thauera sp.]